MLIQHYNLCDQSMKKLLTQAYTVKNLLKLKMEDNDQKFEFFMAPITQELGCCK